MMKSSLVIALVAVLAVYAGQAQLPNFAKLDFLDLEILDRPIDWFLFDFLPTMIDQKPSNQLPNKEVFKEYLMKDSSNDDAAYLTAQQLITRSGYHYELYEAIADDGYVTQVTRLINPLADKRYLRKPPVLLEHGGTIDPTAYIIASPIQHHPEPWPRTARDGPITSWNRSLAFVLANNGFDVWLAETRGSSEKNRKYIPEKAIQSVLEGRNRLKNLTKGEELAALERGKWDFWDFSQDDIIAHEIKSHMDLVLTRTGSQKLLMFTFSLSTPTSFGFFSLRPDYAEKVHALVSMAPIISGEHINRGASIVLTSLCPVVPEKLGTFFLDDLLFTKRTRDNILMTTKSRWFRYKVAKAVSNYLMGASAKYQTLLDPVVLGHMLRPLSFKEAKQLCQQMKTNTLSKFDYGREKNLRVYGTAKPPEYKLSEFHVKDWIVVSAENDGLSTQEGYQHLMRAINPKPQITVLAPGFNHLDLIAGLENDRYVNLPVLSYFQSRSIVPKISDEDIGESQSYARKFDLSEFKIPSMKDFKLFEDLKFPFDFSKEFNSDSSISETIKTLQQELTNKANSGEVVDQLKSSVQNVVSSFGGLESFGNILNSANSQDKEKGSKYDE